MEAHMWNFSSQEAKHRKITTILGHTELHSKFQYSLNYIVKRHLKQKLNKKNLYMENNKCYKMRNK